MDEDRHAGNSDRTDSLDEAEVKALVNRWGKDGFFRPRGWGDRIKVISTRRIPYYALVLETQYEHRTIESRTGPYDDEPVDCVDAPPDLWEIAIPSPAAFESKRIDGTPVPHTQSLVQCTGCSGLGRVDCSVCRGSGRMDRGGAERGCPVCDSRGWVPHAGCSGKGRLRQLTVVNSEFTCKTVGEKLCSVDLPHRLVKEAESEILVEHRREGGGFVSRDLYPEVSPSFQSLWKQSVPRDQSATRILFQRYRIEGLKGFEVLYEAPPASSPRKFWIVGKRVYAPFAPIAWGRIAGAAISAAGACGAILLFALLLSHFSNPSRIGQEKAVPSSVVSALVPDRATSGRAPAPRVSKIRAKHASNDGGYRIIRGVGYGHVDGTSADAGTAPESSDSSANGPNDGQETDNPTPVASSPATNAQTAASGDNGSGNAADNAVPDPDSLEQSPSGQYDVLAGTFTDEADAEQVATQIDDVAYQPTVTPTVDPASNSNDLQYVVTVRGFVSQDAAEEAVQTLKDLGIVAQIAPNTP